MDLSAGRRWQREVLEHYAVNEGESLLIAEAASLIDRLQVIRAELVDAPMLIPGLRNGHKQANPLVELERSVSSALRATIKELKLPPAESEQVTGLISLAKETDTAEGRSEKARRAARARWSGTAS